MFTKKNITIYNTEIIYYIIKYSKFFFYVQTTHVRGSWGFLCVCPFLMVPTLMDLNLNYFPENKNVSTNLHLKLLGIGHMKGKCEDRRKHTTNTLTQHQWQVMKQLV